MDVDGVRHHRGAEHAGGQQHGVRTLEARYQSGRDARGVRRADKEAGQESDRDDAQQEHDDEFEGPLPVPGLDGQQEHGDAADDHGAEGQGQPEEEVERDRPADHFGQVGGGGHDLGLDPERAAPERLEPLAQDLGQALPGDDPELGGLVLDQHGHDVGGHQDPDQEVAVLGAGREVCRHVAGVHVGDRGDECRAQKAYHGAAATRFPPGGRLRRRRFVSCYFQHGGLPWVSASRRRCRWRRFGARPEFAAAYKQLLGIPKL